MLKTPFYLAYRNQLGSIEADIHLVAGKILVGHDTKDLLPSRNLENLYLAPLLTYNTPNRKLQFLIDVKTEAISTLDSLIAVLKKYPTLINNKNITITISGNTPADSLFIQYPSFIHFDGRIFKNYTTAQLSKISLISLTNVGGPQTCTSSNFFSLRTCCSLATCSALKSCYSLVACSLLI